MTSTVGSALEDQFQGYLDHLAIERGVAANTLSTSLISGSSQGCCGGPLRLW